MWKDDSESVDRLFFHFRLARNFSELALSYLGLHWVMPTSVRQQLVAREGLFFVFVFWEGGSSLKFFKLFPMPSFGWCGWRETGEFFDGVEISIERLKGKWLKALFFWKEEVFCYSSIDVVDFVDSLFVGCN